MDIIGYMLLISIATWQSVDIWHHSKLFYNARHWLEGFVELYGHDNITLLLSCPYCLSVWVAILYSLLIYLPGVSTFGLIWVTGVAASKLANLSNDLWKPFFHPHRYVPEPEDDRTTEDQKEADKADRQ